MRGEWYQDDCVGGYYDDDGNFVVCEEYGSDADFGRYDVEVMNGDGYYDSSGRYVAYARKYNFCRCLIGQKLMQICNGGRKNEIL